MPTKKNMKQIAFTTMKKLEQIALDWNIKLLNTILSNLSTIKILKKRGLVLFKLGHLNNFFFVPG